MCLSVGSFFCHMKQTVMTIVLHYCFILLTSLCLIDTCLRPEWTNLKHFCIAKVRSEKRDHHACLENSAGLLLSWSGCQEATHIPNKSN